MKKIKIAVWVNNNYQPEIGGGFSYHSKLINSIDNYSFSNNLEICFVTEEKNLCNSFKRETIFCSYKPNTFFLERLLCHIPRKGNYYQLYKEESILRERDITYHNILKKAGVHLIYYPQQYFCKLVNFPFISTNWDIGHKSTYFFPEISDSISSRAHFYEKVLPKALMIFCESKAGKNELIKYTNINKEKVKVVPLFAGNVSKYQSNNEITSLFLSKYQLTYNQYFLYPAQFWAHKNHYTLLVAFKEFVKAHPDYKLVLSGSDQGNLDYIKHCISDFNISSSIVLPGFVSNEELSILYRNATSLIMPTLMGPTNMPLIEAMEIGCPVICSDFVGHREILGDSALYIDPLNTTQLVSAMIDMIQNRNLYIIKINNQNNNNSFTIENALSCIDKHFQESAKIRLLWNY